MTDVIKTIERVLALDEKATVGPWGWTYDGSSDYSIGPKEDPQDKTIASVHSRKITDDPALIAEYRTLAPRLAKALKLAMIILNNLVLYRELKTSRMVVNEALAEIAKVFE